MKLFWVVLIVLYFLIDSIKSQTCSPSNLGPGTYEFSITSNGISNRTFAVHIPIGYNNQQPVPLLFDFHGFTQTGQGQALLTGYRQKADQEGFVVVHADGVDRQWNVGCILDTGIDDTTFTLDMISFVKNITCVNEKRIYAAGFSVGGFLSHTLGWNTTRIFAAVAPHSGMMCAEYVNVPRPSPIPTFHMHGNQDLIVPYEGLGIFFPTAQESLLQWADVNNCDLNSRTITWSGGPQNSICETYTQCENGVTSTLCTLDGWGHNWYSNRDNLPGYFDSTDFSWDFLKQWSLP